MAVSQCGMPLLSPSSYTLHFTFFSNHQYRNMAWAFWGAYVIDKFGRRPMLLTSLTGMLFLGFLPWTICSALYVSHHVKSAGPPVIAFIFIFNAFYATTWNGILTGYTVRSSLYFSPATAIITLPLNQDIRQGGLLFLSLGLAS
jgi:hypothetical protein